MTPSDAFFLHVKMLKSTPKCPKLTLGFFLKLKVPVRIICESTGLKIETPH
jgi:hypothetical protein